jgi:hypothetical protein
MSELAGTDYLKPFIESTIDAAARFRRVLIVMITASILAFGAFWNSLNETWFNSRIATARNGEAFLTLEDTYNRLTEIEEELGALEQRSTGGQRWIFSFIEEQKFKLKQEQELKEKKQQEPDEKKQQELKEKKLKLEQEQKRLLSDANRILEGRFHRDIKITEAKKLKEELDRLDYEPIKGWIGQRMIPNKEQAAQYAQKLEEARTGNILLIHIPFFGTVFDVNALGLWGGLTFAVLLLLFRFSLWREYNNLRLTFTETKSAHLRFCYRSLAMQQVLTVPPALSPRQPYLKPKGSVVQWLYFPPLIIQTLIFLNDLRTSDIGGMFNFNLTMISTVASLFLWGSIAVLTDRCLQLSAAIDEEWDKAAQAIREASSREEAN